MPRAEAGQSLKDARAGGELQAAKVAQRLAEFQTANPAEWSAIAANEERQHWLRTIFGQSQFLSDELIRHPEWLAGVGDLDRAYSAANYGGRLTGFLEGRNATPGGALEFALFRRRELLRIVLRDVLERATLVEISKELSNLADAILNCALETVLRGGEARYGVPETEDAAGRRIRAGLSVIALGKLGARELNYSSDIDLMFLYGGNGETNGPQPIANKEFFRKAANDFTSLLSAYTGAGVCYRVDLRLRPEGTLGDVCISLNAARDYYARRARDWELQMLIKARVVAGDDGVGQELLDFVEPSIYSTTLDFSMIETMSEARERIQEKVARRRLGKGELDVKLARGGIRDIEFLVQCLQRLHGWRDGWLRHGGTLSALARLRDRDLLSSTEHGRLVNAYRFLRQVEHRLQFDEDRQTHAVPINVEALSLLVRRMPNSDGEGWEGQAGASQFLETLNKHLENVQSIYDSIVYAQRSPLHRKSNPTHRASNGASEAVQEREAGIEMEIGERSRDDRSAALAQHQSPTLEESRAEIARLSPYLAEQLERNAELVLELRRAIELPQKRWAFEGLAAPLADIEGLRRFFRREMFRIQAGGLCLASSVFEILDRTSALAEFLIARAYRIAREQAIGHARSHASSSKPFEEPHQEMTIVALGRLGMREFDVGSDADLLFIIPDCEAVRQQFWTRVAEHVIEILTAYGGEGPILSIDTRLRPNGREGTLVQSEGTYVDYFSTKAEAWEGIAYMKARGVAGDTERATRFLSDLQQVDWRRYGQSGRSRQDLRQMRMRLQREQGKARPLKADEGGFYDADFILMYLRLRGAGLFFKSLNTPERIDIVEKMGHLERGDAEFLLRATTFLRALDHALRVAGGRAEEKLPTNSQQLDMVVELVRRWTDGETSALTIGSELERLRGKLRRLFDSVFSAH